jgi:cytochrome oxidase Cu insertion factor (SCO1/SenC/PrrC family)
MRTALRIIAAVSTAVIVAAAQAPDPKTLGPKVGERVPDFSLPDQRGTARSLNAILGPKGAVLVFFRSADW